MSLVLKGGDLERDLELRRSEVNHLRLMLAWLRCEYMLDDDMQHGFAQGTKSLVDAGWMTEEQGRHSLARKADEIRHVPLYVRQAVKMLTKRIREHEMRGDTVDGERIHNRLAAPSD